MTFAVADAPDGIPVGPYDVITCVAVLHHLPLTETLARFKEQLAPGGILLVVGCARDETAADRFLGHVSVPLNLANGWIKNREHKGHTAPRPASMTAKTRAPEAGYAEIVREAHRILPASRLRRRLFWRYTLVWRA